MRLKYIFSIVLLCFLQAQLFTQEIKGIVLDFKTQKPIEGASVYFDNTTIGSSTDVEGKFSLPFSEAVKSKLIISYLGYHRIILDNYAPNKLYKVLMEEDFNGLNEVVIRADDGMTRAEKLKIFREQFLGFSDFAKSCKILNEDDIRLHYKKKTKTLVAQSKVPLQIENKDLGYLVSFDIKDFDLKFSFADLEEQHFHIESVIYVGTTFYKPLTSELDKRQFKNRNKAYKGSVMHFMRALSKRQLEEEKFQIFSNSFKVDPYRYINVKELDSSGNVEVKLLKPLNILYKKKRQSVIQSNVEYFVIDKYGNHSPFTKILFGGAMGNLRVGDNLPLDFVPNDV